MEDPSCTAFVIEDEPVWRNLKVEGRYALEPAVDTLLIALLTVVASGVGTITGFGTSTIMVPVLAGFLPLPQVLLLVGIIHWFGDIWKMLLFRSGVRWRLILLFGIPGLIATALAGMLVFRAPETLLSRVLGGFLLAYVVWGC